MGNNLYAASRQWASRPADERFETLEDLYAMTRGYYESAATAPVQTRSLAVRPADGDDLVLVGSTGAEAKFTDYSFRQLCGAVGAPSKYLATLPGDLAADCLNAGIADIPGDAKTNLLLHKNGGLVFRGMNSDHYQRVWNWEVAEFCLALREMDPNWRVPPARPFPNCPEWMIRKATAEDVLDMNGNFGLSVGVGDDIAPAGLYASAHDIFVFLVNQARAIEGGNGEVLNRGFYISGSEVAGVSTHRITMFLYEYICGNHIIWGAKDVFEVSFRHVGQSLREKVNAAYTEMRKLADASTADDQARIGAAKNKLLGETKDEVIDLVFDKGIFTRRAAEAAYVTAEKFADIHGDPRTAWGFASGATRMSQETAYADKRNDLDRAAGKVLQMAF